MKIGESCFGRQTLYFKEVTGIRVRHQKVEAVETNKGLIWTGTVIIAGGVWALPLLRDLGLMVPLQPVRIQVALFDRPPVLGTGRPLVTCIDGVNGLYFRSEGPDWSAVLAGIIYRLPLENLDAMIDDADFDYLLKVRERLAKRIPVFNFVRPRGGWAGPITLSPDAKPVIDKHPELKGCYFFTGDSGTSFKTAPAIGRGLAEWVIFGSPKTVDFHPFRASRFAEGVLFVGEHEYDDGPGELASARVG
jgi:sarcosine oxidase subunit beta